MPLVPKKQKRTEGINAPESPKQKQIDQFFMNKLSKEEGLKQAQQRLIQAAEEWEDWVDEEEFNRKKAKVTCHEANVHSQQRCRACKQAKEIADGVHSVDGKIKKVHQHAR
jgi:nucleoid-associated protein YejK